MRKLKDNIIKCLIYLSSLITVGVLLFIIGFIFVKGIGLINIDFFTNEYNNTTYYLQFEPKVIEGKSSAENLPKLPSDAKDIVDGPIYIQKIGASILSFENNSGGISFLISHIQNGSAMKDAVDRNNNKVGISEGTIVERINGERTQGLYLEEVVHLIENQKGSIEMRAIKPGGGVYPNIVTTIYMILLSLGIAAPIGILAAIYLVEYAKPGRIVNIIRFATESLAGIPSIIFGLFGMAFFVVFLKFSLSILAGALTISIILLPTIIRSTEEALKAVPDSYREASYGLGATKLQTISKVILPSAMPGILVAVILSIGRIIGESAALLLTAGTVAKIPDGLFSSGSTLTVQAYYLAKEEANIEMACAIGVVVILLVVVLNIIAKIISRFFNKANY